MTRGLSAESLLRLPVRLRGIKLGACDDLLVDWDARRAVGIEVLCGDGARRFLPLAASRIAEAEVAVGSALLLLDENDLAFYHRRGRAYGDLRGRLVERAGRPLGPLRDILLEDDGRMRDLVVEASVGGRPAERLIRPAADVTVAGPSKVSAA